MQILIAVLLVGVCLVQIPFVYFSLEQKMKYLENVPEGYHFPMMEDFKGSLPPMAVFFFLIGLEVKREIIEGELSSFDKAGLPIVAAIGGMAIPAMDIVRTT